MEFVESSVLWMVLGAVVMGAVSYLFNRKSKKDDEERDLERRVALLEASQRDAAHYNKALDGLISEVQKLTESLANLRLEIAHNEINFYKKIQGKSNG